MPTRLLLVIPTLVRGGAEKQLSLLALGLPRDEFDVHVAVLTHSGPWEQPLREAGIPVHLIGKRWKVDPFAYVRLRRLMRRLQPDIVHTWLFAANSYGRHAAWSVGVKHIVGGERCVDPWKSGLQLSLDRVLARRSEVIVTNSSGVREFYASRGVPAEKFRVIPNGIDARSIPAAGPREELLHDLNLPPETRLIAAVNRLWPQKRVKDLIWASDLLKSARDGWKLLIIGDGPHRWRLQRYRDQVRLGDVVEFLGDRDDVPRILAHSDCLWLASEYEGQSNAIMEAMAAGVPVIASNIPGNRDLVVSGQTGYLVPLGDRAAYARWTDQILEDPALGRRMGAAGRERILREFTVEQMIDRHAELYRQLMLGGDGRASDYSAAQSVAAAVAAER
ncbi:MAG: glycosyltransferase [Pirellulaceae bacterium]|nr:glycosyltransferase [Pirellulaceae bacterium]